MLVAAFRAQRAVGVVRAQDAVELVLEIRCFELSPEVAPSAGVPQRNRARSGVVVVRDHGAASPGCGPEDEGPGLVARYEGADGTQTSVSPAQFVCAIRRRAPARTDHTQGFSTAGDGRRKRRGDQSGSERYCFARRAHHAAISPTMPRRNASTQTTNI